MSMTRPNFEALAEMCADETHEELLCEATIDLLAAFCRSQNNKFDTDKFHLRIAALKAKTKLRNNLLAKGVNKEWFDSHVEVIV